MAVANSASEMPGATTASELILLLADLEEAVHDPPDRAEQADERRHRAHRREEVQPVGEPVRLGGEHAAHDRGDALADAFRSLLDPFDRRHSSTPAAASARQRHLRLAALRLQGIEVLGLPELPLVGLRAPSIRPIRSEKPTTITQTQTLARISPAMTTCTTMSASRNSLTGLRCLGTPAAPAARIERLVMLSPDWCSGAIARKASRHACGCRRGRPSGPTKPTRSRASASSRSSPERKLMHPATGGAQFLGAALDQHRVVEPGRGGVADGDIGDGIGAFARFLRRALVDAEQAQHVRAGALEPAQVVGVIDHAGQVGVLEIGAHGEAVHRPVEQAAWRFGHDAHCPRILAG